MPGENNTLLGGSTPPVTGNEPVIDNTNIESNAGNPPASDNFDWSGMVAENGGFSDNWKDNLPADLKQEKCFDNIHTLPSLLKSYAAAQKMVGANKVSIPSENSPQEEWDAFYKAAGRPDSADHYDTKNIQLPQGISLDDATMKGFREFAYNHGMSQKAFEDAVKFDIQRVQAMQQQAFQSANNEYEETVSKLQQEYGDKLPSVISQCDKALNTFGLTEIFRQHGLLNNYEVIKALVKIGSSISESKLKEGDAIISVRNPEAELAALQADAAFTDRYHPQHDIAVKKATELLNEIIRNRK